MHKSKSPKYSKLQSINLDTKNLQYTISLRENEIEVLKADIQNKKTYILNLEGEISNLRNGCLNNYKIEKELKLYKLKSDNLEKEIDKLNNDIINQQRKFDEEKRNIEKLHQSEILQLKLANDTYSQKIEIANQLMIDKKNLMKEVNSLKQEKDNIIFNNKETMREKEIKNKIKFSNLKKKMMDNINQTQSKVTELNIKYMDVSSKLTLLQNHQLLIQLEYQSQQIDELNEKKEELEKKIFELNKDIDIHKEVELNLAEKNKKLNSEILKLKKGKSENEKNENENKSIINNSISNNNNNNISLGFDENNFINTNYNDALTQIERAKNRGYLSAGGYNNAFNSLQNQMSAARASVGDIGKGIIDDYKSDLTNKVQGYMTDLDNYNLNKRNSMSTSNWANDLANTYNDQKAGLENRFNLATNGLNLFDTSDLIGNARITQGVNNNQSDDLYNAIDEQQQKKSRRVGLGNKGLF